MSLIKAKVISNEIRKREGQSKAGKPYSMRMQEIVVELNGEVRRVDLTLPEDVSGYAPGNYTIDPIEMIEIGRFGFEFARFKEIKLTPVTTPVSNMNKMASGQ